MKIQNLKTKDQAVAMFGGTRAAFGRFMDFATRGAVTNMPDNLSDDMIERIIGKAVRKGLYKIEKVKDYQDNP